MPMQRIHLKAITSQFQRITGISLSDPERKATKQQTERSLQRFRMGRQLQHSSSRSFSAILTVLMKTITVIVTEMVAMAA